MLLMGSLFLLILTSACALDLDYGGTQFRCSEGQPPCPPGLECLDGYCQASAPLLDGGPSEGDLSGGRDGSAEDADGATSLDAPGADGFRDVTPEDRVIRDIQGDRPPDSWPDIVAPPDPCEEGRRPFPERTVFSLRWVDRLLEVYSSEVYSLTFDRGMGGCLTQLASGNGEGGAPLSLDLRVEDEGGQAYLACVEQDDALLIVEEQSSTRIIVYQSTSLGTENGERLDDSLLERRYALYADGQVYIHTTVQLPPAMAPAGSQLGLSMAAPQVMARVSDYGEVTPAGQNEIFISLRKPRWVSLSQGAEGQGAFLGHMSLPEAYQDGIGLSAYGEEISIYWTTGQDSAPSTLSLYQRLQVVSSVPSDECMDLQIDAYRRRPTFTASTYCEPHTYLNDGEEEPIDRATGAIGVDYTGTTDIAFSYSLNKSDQGYHHPIFEIHNLPPHRSPRLAVDMTPLSLPGYYTVFFQTASQPVEGGPWVVQLFIDVPPGQYLHVRADLQ